MNHAAAPDYLFNINTLSPAGPEIISLIRFLFLRYSDVSCLIKCPDIQGLQETDVVNNEPPGIKKSSLMKQPWLYSASDAR
ncbi:hypothetical protein Pvag_pPag20123 (plasmid) [Pantoea vagans C9-1]|nr:hypothetical protein Pvag_pPag20123 [Pantoea vagans C9-1]